MIFLVAICCPDKGLVEARLVSASESFNLSAIVKQVHENPPEDKRDYTYNCLSRLVETVCKNPKKTMKVVTMVHKAILHKKALADEYCFALEEV